MDELEKFRFDPRRNCPCTGRNFGKTLAVAQLIVKYFKQHGEITVCFTSEALRDRVLNLVATELEIESISDR